MARACVFSLCSVHLCASMCLRSVQALGLRKGAWAGVRPDRVRALWTGRLRWCQIIERAPVSGNRECAPFPGNRECAPISGNRVCVPVSGKACTSANVSQADV